MTSQEKDSPKLTRAEATHFGADNDGIKDAADPQACKKWAQSGIKVAHNRQLQACMRIQYTILMCAIKLAWQER